MSARLSETSRQILAHLSDYHEARLFEFEEAARRRKAERDRRHPALLSRAIVQMAGVGLDGAEKEWAMETSKLSPNGYDAHRMFVPWSALTRDLNVASDGAGGYLVGVDVLPAVDVLRPFATVVRAGVTVVEGLAGDATLPRTSATASVTWMADETAAATPSTPTLAGPLMQPKTAIGVVQASRNFQKQASDPEAFIRRELLRTAGGIVDGAVLAGAGSSGEPRGILNVTGVGTQSGTSLAWTGVLHMKKVAADANAQDGTIAFIGTTAVRELLEARTKESGGGRYIWEDDRIASCPAYASTLMPTATLLSGPFGMCYLGLWGPGIVVEVNPFDPTLFKSGVIQVRLVVACDVALGCDPAAFTKSASIT
jgi:HK97 family phage major capsid protein